MIIKLMVEGGSMKPNAAISQKLGPLGINIGKIISDVNVATKDFSGMKVPVILNIDSKTKAAKIEVASPPASGLLKKEFGLEKGSPQPHKIKMANAAIEHIIKVAKSKQGLEKNLKSAVKTILGCCVSLGILVESKEPKEVSKEVDAGVYDAQIKQEMTVPSKEKLSQLASFFEGVKKAQEEIMKKELEAKAAEEEKAAQAATVAGAAAPAAAAAPGAAPAAEKKEAAKPAAK